MQVAPPELVFPGDGEMAKLMRDKAWESTSLGPVESWPPGLRSAVRIVLTSRFSMWMGWGDDLAFLYNDAYRADTLGLKHPSVLGRPTREVWSEIWSEIGPRIAVVLQEGRATWDEGLLLILERSAYREETYHTFSYSPLHDDDGKVRGVLCVVIEETGRLISERRVGLLGKLASETARARTADDLLAGLERSLSNDSRDLPFTLTYLFDGEGTAAQLASQTGFPDRWAGALATIDVASSPWRLGELLETGGALEVALDVGAWPTGPWASPPTRAFVVPIAQQGQSRPTGVFIAGLNPHRTFDAGYREFLALLVGQLAAGFASARAYDAERRRAETDRHAQRLASVFEHAPVAIAILRGPDHVFEIANPAYRRIVGGDVTGRAVAEAVPAQASPGFVELLDRVFQTGEPFVGHSVQIRQQRVEGGPFEEAFFDLSYQPLLGDTGQVMGIAAIGHEVTALATARRDAEMANRAKDEFLAMLGHELRNPLAPIMTALELMRLRPDVGAERERAVIERQVHHLVGLVDDLLDVSRITRGKVELRPEAVEIAEVVARSVEVVSPLLEEHRHVLTVEVAAGQVVYGDPVRLAQVISNLLTNAAKYTPNGGHIVIRAVRDADRVKISVIDDGVGIEPTMLQRVFEPFAQERQSIDRAQGGLGLGLAIVDNLVKLHGGAVSARSGGRGHGSEFTVSLPLLDSPDLAISSSRRRRIATAGKARILIVDDNVDAAQMLADLLAAGGYRTLAAYDGPSALQAARAFQPQIAVVDLGLPVMDGFELARHLLARTEATATKLVALTGYGQPQDRARTAAAGFEAHLVKPVDIEQLRTVIEQLLPASRR